MRVYVVIAGERNEGGGVRDVRLRLDEARIAALLETPPASGPWILDEEKLNPESFQNGDTLVRWESGCDFVEVQVWEAK